MTDRPNILYILTDQQSASALGCVDPENLTTPAMDGLAAGGVRFDRAYCTYPLCSPSRASMITGLMPHQVGVYDNEQTIAEPWANRELGHVMAAAGYDCAWGGKWHVPERSLPGGHGFRTICPFDDLDLADRCIQFLERPRDDPFFLVASFDNPHNICEWARQQPLPWGAVAEAPIADCPNLPPNFLPPAYEAEAVAAERTPRPRSIFRGGSLTEDEWRLYRHVYFRLTEKVDAEIGRILAALRSSGLEEETLVIFSSDHGDGMGAHRWNQKSVLYEESVRVPLILSWPGRIEAGIVDDEHLASNGLDLYPTICDFAGVEPPRDLIGRSLRPLVDRAETEEWRHYVVAETLFGAHIGGLGTEGRMVRSARFKYVRYSWGRNREQLYDLAADPGEMVNLAVESRFRELLDEHRHLLSAWSEATGDVVI